MSVRDLALRIDARGGFRRCTWRKATKQDLSARFALRRVTPAGDNAERDVQWLLIEWRDGEKEPANYFLATLPESITKRQLIRLVMQRRRTERVYEDLKGELGLDHFEGRRFPGWHHHISVALCCYAFIVAERVRRSSPSARRALGHHPEPRDRSGTSRTASSPLASPSLGPSPAGFFGARHVTDRGTCDAVVLEGGAFMALTPAVAQRNNLRGFAKPDPVEGSGDEFGGVGALVDYLGAL